MKEAVVVELRIPTRQTLIPATLLLPAAPGPYPLVAFAHGFSGTRHEGGGYTAIARSLGCAGIASIRMDFPGCGDSTESFRLCTLSNMVQDLRTCIAYAVTQYPIDTKRMGVVGMSLGGRVAMELINSDPTFCAALLLAPAADNACIRGVIGSEEDWQRCYMTAKSNGFAPIPCYFGGPDLELSPAWFEDFEQMDTLSNASPTAQRQVLVIYAADDLVVLPAFSKRCAAAYGAQLAALNGDGHSYGCYSDRKDILLQLIEMATIFFTAAL